MDKGRLRRSSVEVEKVLPTDLPTHPPVRGGKELPLGDGVGESSDMSASQELFKRTCHGAYRNLESKPTHAAPKGKKRAERKGTPKAGGSSVFTMTGEDSRMFCEDDMGGPSRIFYDGDKTAGLFKTPHDDDLTELPAKLIKKEPDEAEHFGMVIASYIRRCHPRLREEMHVALLKTAGEFVSHDRD